jgi:thiosulfate/3-mercaptopyruvate sulfurtransferase
LAASFARQDILVGTDWLAAHLDDPNVRIVDCDVPDAYARAHIPGAVNYRDHYYKNPDDQRYIMTPPQFAEAMAILGIGDETIVVGYDNLGSRYSGRLWWCLTYYGHTRVHVLEDGWSRWLQEGRPVTEKVPLVQASSAFTPRPNESMLASADYVLAALSRPEAVVLDVRAIEEWEGTETRGNKRGGHMPGAVHLEWLDSVREAPVRGLKPAGELKAMFEAAGVTPDKEVITVCQAGIRAAQASLVLNLLGYNNIRVYDASFREWGNREDTPIVC